MINWERLAAQSNGLYEEQDYQQAAYRLTGRLLTAF